MPENSVIRTGNPPQTNDFGHIQHRRGASDQGSVRSTQTKPGSAKERMTGKPTVDTVSNPQWINKLKDRFENVSDNGTFVAIHSPFEYRLIIRMRVDGGGSMADDQ